MATVFEIVKKRRSIRKFKDQPVEDDKIKKILEAGVWAPSAGNLQPWVFIAVRDKRTVEKIKAISPGMFDVPPVLIVVCRDMEIAKRSGNEELSLLDVAMASQNMMLVACELYLGTCPIKSFNQKAVQVLLDLPEHIIPELLLAVGYPDVDPAPPRRREGTIYFERYGEDNGFSE